MSAKKKNKSAYHVLKSVMSTSMYFLLILVITMLLLSFVVQKNVVVGESMNPALTNGNMLICDKLSYRLHNPERYDVIVFPAEHEKDAYLIKRIIGLPGESVRIDSDGTIYISDILLKENYGLEPIKDPGLAVSAVTLGEDEYFVLGDNRNDSVDSRSMEVWLVKRDKITGRALIKFWPLPMKGLHN